MVRTQPICYQMWCLTLGRLILRTRGYQSKGMQEQVESPVITAESLLLSPFPNRLQRAWSKPRISKTVSVQGDPGSTALEMLSIPELHLMTRTVMSLVESFLIRRREMSSSTPLWRKTISHDVPTSPGLSRQGNFSTCPTTFLARQKTFPLPNSWCV